MARITAPETRTDSEMIRYTYRLFVGVRMIDAFGVEELLTTHPFELIGIIAAVPTAGDNACFRDHTITMMTT